jgi:hypothetical protein
MVPVFGMGNGLECAFDTPAFYNAYQQAQKGQQYNKTGKQAMQVQPAAVDKTNGNSQQHCTQKHYQTNLYPVYGDLFFGLHFPGTSQVEYANIRYLFLLNFLNRLSLLCI